MPATPVTPTAAHGELDCADVESLLAEAAEEIAELRTQVADLTRRLTNTTAQKQQAIDEAVTLRSGV